jgi:hypothetical protein
VFGSGEREAPHDCLAGHPTWLPWHSGFFDPLDAEAEQVRSVANVPG